MLTTGQEFIKFCIDCDVLRFGSFKTKAGRDSPYFFNAGLFDNGSKLALFAAFYGMTLLEAIEQKGLKCDMLFGPAYKGIPLVAATATVLAMGMGVSFPFSFNRKEVKDHGEGGNVIGAPIEGNVIILDDVISAGTSVRESIEIIKANGGNPAGIIIALDRMERAGDAKNIKPLSAVEDVEQTFGIPVIAIATLEDLLGYLKKTRKKALLGKREKIETYLKKYGSLKIQN